MTNAYKLLPIVNNAKSIVVDAPLYPILSRYRWYLPKSHYAGTPRPYTIINRNGKYHQLRLARSITKASDHQYPKHLNGDPLDCRRGNLELVSTRAEAGLKRR